MRTFGRIQVLLLATAVCGMLVPQPELLAEQLSRRSLVADVSLDTSGALRGQMVDQNGVAIAGHEVLLLGRGRVVGRALTNAKGQFRVDKLNGGVFVVSDGENSQGVRLWTAQAAPRNARPAILLVKDGKTTRAQWTDGVQRGFLSDYSAGEFLAVGLVTAGIIALVADASDSSP